MTRDEAIRILDPEFVANEFAKYDEEHGIRDVEHLKAIYEACVLAVEALREQERLRWIPVTERLPEQGERVLATDGGFVGELYVNSRGQWKRYNVNDHSLLMALDILWWMPMPQPPKEAF